MIAYISMQTLSTVLPYIQIALSIVVIALVLIQRSDADLGSAFGGEGGGTKFARRGFEKTLFNATIISVILFVAASLFSLIV